MKIAVTSGAFIPMPPAGFGAVERVWDGVTRQLVKNGHEVNFFSRSHPSQKDNEIIEGVSFVRRTQFKQTGISARQSDKGFYVCLPAAAAYPKGGYFYY